MFVPVSCVQIESWGEQILVILSSRPGETDHTYFDSPVGTQGPLFYDHPFPISRFSPRSLSAVVFIIVSPLMEITVIKKLSSVLITELRKRHTVITKTPHCGDCFFL